MSKESGPCSPDQIDLRPMSDRLGSFFTDLCMSGLKQDGIDYADASPNFPDQVVIEEYDRYRNGVGEYADMPFGVFASRMMTFPERRPVVPRERVNGKTLRQHCIEVMLGSVRYPTRNDASQIGLANDELEPGGRFAVPGEDTGRRYGWDRWPVLRGAFAALGQWGIDRARSTLANSRDLSDKTGGNLPNVNAPWGAGRPHPIMEPRILRIEASLSDEAERSVLAENLEMLEEHYNFWNDGADDPTKLKEKEGSVYRRVVRGPNGRVIYRDADDRKGPRDEMYKQDMETLTKLEIEKLGGRKATQEERDHLFDGIRVLCARGLDFRSYKGQTKLYETNAADYASVMASALMYELVVTLALGYRRKAEGLKQGSSEYQIALDKALDYENRSQDLGEAILESFRTDDGFFEDRKFTTGEVEPGDSMVGIYVLGAGLVPWNEGREMLDHVDRKFSRPGGFPTTLYRTEEQWDYNAWAIIQLEAIDAAILYGRYDLALKWSELWVECNELMYDDINCLAENSDPDRPGKSGARQGEYDCVPDLLMSIGTHLALIQMLPWLRAKAAKMNGHKKVPLGGHIGALATVSGAV